MQIVSLSSSINSTHFKWFERRLWLALPVLALPALIPFLVTGLTASADGATHLMRTALFFNHWRQGELFPRWVPELMTGLGYPVFSYYGAMAYVLASLLLLIGLSLVNSLIAVFALFMLAAGFGMYLLARELFGVGNPWAALLAATAYMYAPYLLSNVFIRGAIAEVGAQALLPWILWCARRLITTDKPAAYITPFALSLAALAVTHTVTLIIFPPFLLGYLLVIWWQHGHRRARLGWMAAGIGAAMGLSAFFWVPLIAESSYLSQDAFGTSTEIFIPENLWRWQTFLDTHFPYEYTFAVPYQLGLIQIVFAVAGLFFVRRWDLEWLYLLLVTGFACLAVGAWAEPIWLSNRVLLAVQFPWRLLTIISVTLALFTGAIVWRIQRPRRQALTTLVLALLIILANRPQVGWMGEMETENGGIPLPAIARHESITGQVGTGPTREFMPRWNQGITYIPATTDVAIGQADISLRSADGYGLEAEVSSLAGGPLRFTNLYFPGWQATLDDAITLNPYPSTNLGLLTVDVPPGSHYLRLTNPGTDLQRWATWVTLATLAGLLLLAWRARSYWMLGVCALLLLVGGVAQMRTPQPAPTQLPAQPLQTDDFTLLGYRVQHDGQQRLLIYPTWYVRQTPQADIRFGWALRDNTGETINLTATRPYFNSQRAGNWPPGTIADDAYELALPSELAAGRYDLVMHQLLPDGSATAAPATIGVVALEAAMQDAGSAEPLNPLSLQFGDVIHLDGYDVRHNQEPPVPAGSSPIAVRPGDTLKYTLHWSADAPPPDDYHGFVHLVDWNGDALVQEDHLPGSIFHPPMTWDTAHVQHDSYTLRVPANLTNGLVWPTIGLYRFDSQQRLPVRDSAGQTIGNAYRLPPIKVFGATSAASPPNVVDAAFGEGAALLGYELTLPEQGLHPGSQFTLTLYYEGRAPMAQDLTQFVHLYDPALGMAAQQDAPPLGGANPTSTWLPGEIIVDRFTLQIDDTAAPGVYTLGAGLYNPLDGARVPVTNAAGEALLDQVVPLMTLRIEP